MRLLGLTLLTASLLPAAAFARLNRSFAFCTSALAKVGGDGLGETVPFLHGRTISRAGPVLNLAADWADHYGASGIYLRLNGILPPTARKTRASE